MVSLILVTSAFYWYLSWARRARQSGNRQTHRQTHTHFEYCNLAPARARLVLLSAVLRNDVLYNLVSDAIYIHDNGTTIIMLYTCRKSITKQTEVLCT